MGLIFQKVPPSEFTSPEINAILGLFSDAFTVPFEEDA
jgi:hypothetical protein